MPYIAPAHIVSFSSEDPHNPASNLLTGDSFRRWKCKEEGEKEAFVVFKFDKAVSFTGIDIGNDGSAFVEVSVARSGNGGEPEFEVLLASCAFMSPKESRESSNLRSVRQFTNHTLSKPIAAQKWDLVKVLVTQNFNTHVQFGLSFIKFMAAPDPSEALKIGGFGLRKAIGGADSDDDDDIKPGSLFSKLKSPKEDADKGLSVVQRNINTNSTHSDIMKTSAKLANASKLSNDEEVKSLLQQSKPTGMSSSPSTSSSSRKLNSSTPDDFPVVKRKQLPDPAIKSSVKNKDDKPSNGSTTAAQKQRPSTPPAKPKPNNGTPKNNSSKKRTLSPDPPTRGSPSSSSPKPSSSSGTPPKKQKSRTTKPFNKLFEGVIFSMSGFENPTRGQLRDKAVEMGAKYRNNWDRNCTHLICAFFNTPKFREVRAAGNGEIVRKDWIERSYADKRRYPWRRYCLDRNDRAQESEEEIFAEGEEDEEEDDDATEDETSKTTNKKRRIFVMESSDEGENSNDNDKDKDSKKAYDADTDVDEDVTPDLSPSILSSSSDSSMFKGSHFCISSVSSNNCKTDAATIKQIILKHKGTIHKVPTDTTDFFICLGDDWNDEFTDILSDNPNITFVNENWILESDKEDTKLDTVSFIVIPS